MHIQERKMKIKILQKQRNIDHCEQCGSKENLTIDHKIPKAFLRFLDLEHLADNKLNLQILCSICNEYKGNRLLLNEYRSTIDKILDYAQKKQSEEKEIINLFAENGKKNNKTE